MVNMGVSINAGIPTWMVFNGKPHDIWMMKWEPPSILSKGNLPSNKGLNKPSLLGLMAVKKLFKPVLEITFWSPRRADLQFSIYILYLCLFVPKKPMTKFVRNIMMALSWNHKFIWIWGTRIISHLDWDCPKTVSDPKSCNFQSNSIC